MVRQQAHAEHLGQHFSWDLGYLAAPIVVCNCAGCSISVNEKFILISWDYFEREKGEEAITLRYLAYRAGKPVAV